MDTASRRPHGNCRGTTSHVHQRTISSTIEKIDELVTRMPGSQAYKHLVAKNNLPVGPRNVAQCHYRRQKYLNRQKMTNDEIRNLLLLSYDLSSYFKLLQIQPEVLVVLIHDAMKEEFGEFIRKTQGTIPLFYDTTFFWAMYTYQ